MKARFRFVTFTYSTTVSSSTKSSGGWPQCGHTRAESHCPASSSSMVTPANRATRSASAGVTARLPVATFWIESHSYRRAFASGPQAPTSGAHRQEAQDNC